MNNDNKITKYQTTLPTVMSLVFAVFLLVAAAVCVKCFPLYSLDGGFDSYTREVVWTFMSLPAVILPISLLLTNLVGRKYSKLFIVLSFICCACFVAIRIILSYRNDTEICYTLFSVAFYMIFLWFCVAVKEALEPFIKSRALQIVLSSVTSLLYGMVVMLLLISEIKASYFTVTALYFALPFIMLALLLAMFCLKLSGRLTKTTFITALILPLIGVLLAMFEFAYTRISVMILVIAFAIFFIKLIYDIFAGKVT